MVEIFREREGRQETANDRQSGEGGANGPMIGHSNLET